MTKGQVWAIALGVFLATVIASTFVWGTVVAGKNGEIDILRAEVQSDREWRDHEYYAKVALCDECPRDWRERSKVCPRGHLRR